VDAGLTALSNMPVISEEEEPAASKKVVVFRFAETPLMSTYLVAFAVGQFDYVEVGWWFDFLRQKISFAFANILNKKIGQ
jgi:aminopeptidase N